MRSISKADYLHDYKIKVVFDNGIVKVCDLSKWNKFKGVFEDLKDKEKFQQFYIEDGVLKWSDWQDVCPDKLYQEGELNVN